MRFIDAHTHAYNSLENPTIHYTTADDFGFEKINVLGIPVHGGLSQNLECAYLKHLQPERTYAFGGLEHVSGRSYLSQARNIQAMGFEGFKMLEGKPTSRKKVDIPLDAEVYDDFYSFLEETGMPLLLHVADPDDFWDADRIPKWALEKGWLYDESFVPYEQLYREVDGVLRKHPRMKLILAHFFFLSNDMPRARALLAKHENLHFDITSGFEMYCNFSLDPDLWRAFFLEHHTRLIFGTDSTDSPDPNVAADERAIIHAQIHFLTQTGEKTFRGSPIRGIGLTGEPLENIAHANFERLTGPVRALNIDAVRAEAEYLSRLDARSARLLNAFS